VSSGALPVTRSRRQPRDPAESWELPSSAELAPSFRGICDCYPRTPRWEEDIPASVLKSLQDLCGIDRLGQVFIIPETVRSIGWKERRVVSPESVLALGSRAVALWTGKPEPGIKACVPLDQIAAIEDVTILLYGRLSFISPGTRLTVRYNILARRGFEPALRELRRMLAGPARPVPRNGGESSSLPFKWRRLLEAPLVRLSGGAPVAFRFARVRRRAPFDIERGELLALTPSELLFLCDPPDAGHTYGEDSCVVSRARITRVLRERPGLRVCSNGAELPLAMEPALSEAAAGWLA